MNEHGIFIELASGARIEVAAATVMRLAADYLLRRGEARATEGSYNLELDRETWATVACVARPAGEGLCGDTGAHVGAPPGELSCVLPAGHVGFLHSHVGGDHVWTSTTPEMARGALVCDGEVSALLRDGEVSTLRSALHEACDAWESWRNHGEKKLQAEFGVNFSHSYEALREFSRLSYIRDLAGKRVGQPAAARDASRASRDAFAAYYEPDETIAEIRGRFVGYGPESGDVPVLLRALDAVRGELAKTRVEIVRAGISDVAVDPTGHREPLSTDEMAACLAKRVADLAASERRPCANVKCANTAPYPYRFCVTCDGGQQDKDGEDLGGPASGCGGFSSPGEPGVGS